MGDNVLTLAGLNYSYGGLRVTDNVNLEVRAGELHAIIGPNGAGKTSLADQICGRKISHSGKTFFENEDISQYNMSRRANLGIVRCFQITSIFPNFTALENVALSVQASCGSSFRFFKNANADVRINRLASDVLEAVGLINKSNTISANMSHGEKRQLELAIALARKPKLIVLDEPLAGTGSEEAHLIISLLMTLKRTVAMVLVEHDMNAVFELADRVSVLVYGKMIATDAPAAIKMNREVRAAYLGSSDAES